MFHQVLHPQLLQNLKEDTQAVTPPIVTSCRCQNVHQSPHLFLPCVQTLLEREVMMCFSSHFLLLTNHHIFTFSLFISLPFPFTYHEVPHICRGEQVLLLEAVDHILGAVPLHHLCCYQLHLLLHSLPLLSNHSSGPARPRGRRISVQNVCV